MLFVTSRSLKKQNKFYFKPTPKKTTRLKPIFFDEQTRIEEIITFPILLMKLGIRRGSRDAQNKQHKCQQIGRLFAYERKQHEELLEGGTRE